MANRSASRWAPRCSRRASGRLSSASSATSAPREQLVRRLLERATCPGQRRARLGGRDRPDRDLRLREARDRADVLRKLLRLQHLVDGVTSRCQPSEQDLRAREDEPLHRGVAHVAELGQRVGRCAGGLRGRRRIAVGHRDLDARGLDARPGQRLSRELRRAIQGGSRELEITELRVRDPAQRQAEPILGAPHETERPQRVSTRQGAAGGDEIVRKNRARAGHHRQHRPSAVTLSRPSRGLPPRLSCHAPERTGSAGR